MSLRAPFPTPSALQFRKSAPERGPSRPRPGPHFGTRFGAGGQVHMTTVLRFPHPDSMKRCEKGSLAAPPPEPARDLKSLFSGVQNGVRKRSPKRIIFFPGNLQKMVPNRPKRPMLHPGAPGSSKMAPKVTQGLQRDTKSDPKMSTKSFTSAVGVVTSVVGARKPKRC